MPQGHAPVIREMVVPVIRGQAVTAILGVGNKQNNYLDQDLEVVKALADTAWELVLKKQTQEEIELTQKRFLAILNGIESTIYVTDFTTHEILFMNNYMKTLFGGDLTGKKCWKALRHLDEPCPHCSNRFLTDKNSEPTGIHLWEDKHPVTGRWNIYRDRAIKWVDGRLARLQIATDVTRLKQMERTQREYEDKIRQAQKMEALGALAGGIAHDFNNILFPILGYAELLKEEFQGSPAHDKGLDEILSGAMRARELVDQILTFSRQTEHKIGPLKPDLVIKEVIRLVQSTLPSFIHIKKYVARDCKMIMADPTQFHQIAMNLITNAFHAMEDKGGILTVKLENILGQEHDLPRQGPYIRLRVEDNGMGMDPLTLEKIFEPYFTTKPAGKGTGLGLSLVHGIVKKYRGEIKIDSVPGRGTRIEVFIPAKAGQPMADPEAPIPDPAHGSERLLLVDDDPQVLRLEREILERSGYTVQIETSSKTALALVRTNPDLFDLIVTDMTMPEMTGDLLTQKVRKICPGIPIIICTGFSERMDPKRAQTLGVNWVLSKPVSKSDLVKTVRDALDGTLN
ncbi:MAG: response regulator [Desulfobacter sp.]|nr:response regulator [Desulfobacter sp.]